MKSVYPVTPLLKNDTIMPMSEKCNLFVRKSELFHLVKVWYDDKVPNKYSTKLRCISIRIKRKIEAKPLCYKAMWCYHACKAWLSKV
jgi:hypothetical protein